MHLTTRFDEALRLAARLHREQTRKHSHVPYLAHLLAVAALVLECGGSEDEAIAALLHDALEDQGDAVTLEGIEARFGPTVASIVEACSDAQQQPKPPWRQRKVAHVERMTRASPSVRLVALADKLHNAGSILRDHTLLGPSVWNRFTAGREGTLWYYRAMLEALSRGEPLPLVAELRAAVERLEQLD